MKAIERQQFSAYAAQNGTIIGLMWIVSFAFYIVGLSHPLIGNLSLLFGLLSLYCCVALIKKFKREITPINFWQSWRMSILIYMYASLLIAMAQFIYFQYIDNGLLFDTYASVIQQPEMTALLQNMLPGEDINKVINETIDTLRSITPINLTFKFLTNNLFLGLILSVPTAGFSNIGKSSSNHTKL